MILVGLQQQNGVSRCQGPESQVFSLIEPGVLAMSLQYFLESAHSKTSSNARFRESTEDSSPALQVRLARKLDSPVLGIWKLRSVAGARPISSLLFAFFRRTVFNSLRKAF